MYALRLQPRQSLRRGHVRWMWLVVGLALVFQTGIARAAGVGRKPSESDDDFMARVVGPSSQLAQKVVRSRELAGGNATLIGFFNAEDDSLVGHLLIETSPGHYEHVTFPSCGPNGGAPELLAVFFARTAKDGGRDLAVLCQWETRNALANGMAYAAEFYRLKDSESKPTVEPLKDLNEKFITTDLYNKEHGKWVKGSTATFSTVAEIKKLLTKMGLKQ